MSNAELIEQTASLLVTVAYAHQEFDNYDHVLHHGNVKKLTEALELADKRIAELEALLLAQPFRSEREKEAERKLAVAREALSAMWLHYKSLVDSGDAGNWTPEDEPVCKQAIEALAQISPKCRRFVEPPIISPAPHVGISCTARRHQSASA